MLMNNQQFVKQLYVIVCYILYVNEQSTICKAAICYIYYMLMNNQQFVKQLYVIVCYILYVNEQSTICKAAICYSVLYIIC